MLETCLAPVILAGYVTAIELGTNVSQDYANQGAIVQALSCDKGLGIGLKTTTIGLYAVEGHYGVKYHVGDVSIALLPKLGVSATDTARPELPQGVQFSLGAQALLGYKQARVGVEYWHMSNGSALGLALTDKPNIGLDMLSFTLGWSF